MNGINPLRKENQQDSSKVWTPALWNAAETLHLTDPAPDSTVSSLCLAHPIMRYLEEQKMQDAEERDTSLRRRHPYIPLDHETKPIKQVLMVQPEDIIPNIPNHNKRNWIPWLGIFACPFATKNWRNRKPDAYARHAANRYLANQRNHPWQHSGHEQWTSTWTEPTYNHQQWQTRQNKRSCDTSHSYEQQHKRPRGDTSYGGGSSSSSYSHWDSSWSSWQGRQRWHGRSW